MDSAVIYCRQSLDRTGEGAAVTRQLEDCRALVARRGFTLAREPFIDNDTSAAGRKQRDDFDAMLHAVEAGEAAVVVAWAYDRLTRNRRDELRLVETFKRHRIVLALVQGSDIDMSTPAGELTADTLANMARFEINVKSARQKRAQQQAAQQGRPAGGRRAFGYESDGMTVCSEEATLIAPAYESIMLGGSLKGIAKDWNTRGFTTTMGNPWRHDGVRGVLLNHRYAGIRTYRGEVVGPAVWPALVDQDTFEAVRAVLLNPARRTTTDTARKHLLPAIALCWKCGSDVATAHTRHGKRTYQCRANKCIARAAQSVDDWVEKVVIGRLRTMEVADLLTEPEVDRREELLRQAAELDERLEDLATALGDGTMKLSSYQRVAKGVEERRAGVEAALMATVEVDALRPLVAADDVEAAWHALELEQKRAVIRSLMTITLLPPKRGRQAFDPRDVRISWKRVRS